MPLLASPFLGMVSEFGWKSGLHLVEAHFLDALSGPCLGGQVGAGNTRFSTYAPFNSYFL